MVVSLSYDFYTLWFPWAIGFLPCGSLEQLVSYLVVLLSNWFPTLWFPVPFKSTGFLETQVSWNWFPTLWFPWAPGFLPCDFPELRVSYLVVSLSSGFPTLWFVWTPGFLPCGFLKLRISNIVVSLSYGFPTLWFPWVPGFLSRGFLELRVSYFVVSLSYEFPTLWFPWAPGFLLIIVNIWSQKVCLTCTLHPAISNPKTKRRQILRINT